MQSSLRVVMSIPLAELWDDEGNLPHRRVRGLGAVEIRALMRNGPVRFVIANGGERNLLGADGDAVLSVAAVLNASFFHQGVEALVGVILAGWIRVEKNHLADGMCADETAIVGRVFPRLECLVTFAIHPLQLDL